MTNVTLNSSEIQQLVFQMFGNSNVTAISTDNFLFLTPAKNENNNPKIALNKLCGIFKNTNLLSSVDFAKNKIKEIELEEKV